MLSSVHGSHDPARRSVLTSVSGAPFCIDCLVHALTAEPLLGVAQALVHETRIAAEFDQRLAWQLASAESSASCSLPHITHACAHALARACDDDSFCTEVIALSDCLCQAHAGFWAGLTDCVSGYIVSSDGVHALFDALAHAASIYPAARLIFGRKSAHVQAVVDAAATALHSSQPADASSAARFLTSLMTHRQPYEDACVAVAASAPAIASGITAALIRFPHADHALVAISGYNLLTALADAHLVDMSVCAAGELLDCIKASLLASQPLVQAASATACAALCTSGPGGACACAVDEHHLIETVFEAMRPMRSKCQSQADTSTNDQSLRACVAVLSALSAHAECTRGLSSRLSIGAPALAAQLRSALAIGDFTLVVLLCTCMSNMFPRGTRIADLRMPRQQALGLAHVLSDGVVTVHDMLASTTTATARSASTASQQRTHLVESVAPAMCTALAALARAVLPVFGADIAAVYKPACVSAVGIVSVTENEISLAWLSCLGPTCDLVAAFISTCASSGASTAHATECASDLCLLADAQLLPSCLRAVECSSAMRPAISWCASWCDLMTALTHGTASAVPVAMRAALTRKLIAAGVFPLALRIAQCDGHAHAAVSGLLVTLLTTNPSTQQLMPARVAGAEDAWLHILRMGPSVGHVLAAMQSCSSEAIFRAVFLLLFASLPACTHTWLHPHLTACHAVLDTYITHAAAARMADAQWCCVLMHLWASFVTAGHQAGVSMAESALVAAYVRAVDVRETTIAPDDSITCSWLFSFATEGVEETSVRQHCISLLSTWLKRHTAVSPMHAALLHLLSTDSSACALLLDVIIDIACSGGDTALLAAALDVLHRVAWSGPDALAQALRPRLSAMGDALCDLMIQPFSEDVTPALMRALCGIMHGWCPPPPLGSRFSWTHAGICAATAIEHSANAAATSTKDELPLAPGVMPCAMLLASCLRMDACTLLAGEATVHAAVSACLQSQSCSVHRAIGACLAAHLAETTEDACAAMCIVTSRQLCKLALFRTQMVLRDETAIIRHTALAALIALVSIVERCGDALDDDTAALVYAVSQAHAVGASLYDTHRTRAAAWRLLNAMVTRRGVASAAISTAWMPFIARDAAQQISEVGGHEGRSSVTEAAIALASLLQALPPTEAAEMRARLDDAALGGSLAGASPMDVPAPYISTPERCEDLLLPPWPPTMRAVADTYS